MKICAILLIFALVENSQSQKSDNQIVYDVAVIGGGLFGSSVAKYVSEDVENSILIGPSESTKDDIEIYGAWFDEGRIAELADSEDAWYTLAKQSIGRFREIEAKSGIKFFNENGFLNVLSESDAETEDLQLYEELCGQIVEDGHTCIKMNKSFTEATFPYLNLPSDFVAFYQPNFAGVINPRRLVEAQLKIASDQGLEIVDGHVTNVARDPNTGFAITFSSEDVSQTVHAKKIVIATGAYVNLNTWLQTLLPPELQNQKPDIVLAKETVAFLELTSAEAERLKNFPNIVTHYYYEELDGSYILPPVKYPDGKIYLKLGHSDYFEDEIPDDGALEEMTSWYQGSGYPEVVDLLTKFIQQGIIPDLSFNSVHGGACVIAVTPDSVHPYVGQVADGVILVAGGNGCGANGSDEIGRIGAKLATSNEWTSEIPQDELAVQWKSRTTS